MILALAMAVTLAQTPLSDVYLEARRHPAQARFVRPSQERREQMKKLAAELAAAVGSGKLAAGAQARAEAAGLELVAARDAAGEVWVLREPAGRREGAGLYVFRPKGAPICVQAPHIFFDEGTGEIALAVATQLKAACVFFNTLHRNTASDAGDGAADVAHAESSLFLSATEGLLQAVRWPIVQLHGFGRETLPPGTLAVVSEGSKAPPKGGPGARMRSALEAALGQGTVRQFGVDAKELGATSNVEGERARRAGAPFLHIEMSASLRSRLKESGVTPLAEALGKALSLP